VSQPTLWSRSYVAAVGPAKLHVQEWGAGPALLCIHGLGGGGHFFSALGPALAGCCRTIAVDLPGAGLSPPLPEFSFDTAASVVVSLARQHEWPHLCVLGHSMGTILALEAARGAPDLVRGLVLVGGLPEPTPAARARIAERVERVRRDGIIGVGEEAVVANFSERTRRERPELTGLFARLFEMQSADGYIDAAEALCAWTGRPLPPLAGVPCLAITGAEDLYAPPDEVRAFARSLPAGTEVEVLPDCGHLPFLEQPVTFSAIVRRFLDPES
jgi:pimeloyl-ACP methyl ester carboxylesterase